MSSSSNETEAGTPVSQDAPEQAIPKTPPVRGGASHGAAPADAEVENFDFSRPRVLRHNQQEGLDTLFSNVCQLVGPTLKHEMGTDVIVEYLGGEVVYFDPHLSELTDPINVFPIKYRGFEFNGVLSLDDSISFWLVDTLLGGETKKEDRGRSLTDTESAVATKVVDLLVDEIHTSWSPQLQVEGSVYGFLASQTQFHNLKPPSLAYVCRFSVQWQSGGGHFDYMVPLKLLTPLVNMMEPKSEEQREKRLSALFGTLGKAFLSVDLDVSAVLGRPTLLFRELGQLKVGDILPLNRKIEDPIEVTIQGEPKIWGSFGVQRGNYTIIVENWIRNQ